MSSNKGWARIRLFWRNWTLLGVFLAVLMLIASIWFGRGGDTSVNLADAENASVDTAAKPSPPRIELDETKPAPSLFARIEEGFGVAVKGMAAVFFRRVGGQDLVYVQLNHTEQYWRPRDSKSDVPFVKHDPQGTFDAQTISEQRAGALAAQDKLELSSEDRGDSGKKPYIRNGKIGTEKVEFLSVIIDKNSKYVWDEDDKVFKKSNPREQVSEKAEDRLSKEQVAKLASLGRLTLDPDKLDEKGNVKPGVSNPHLLIDPKGAPIVVLWLVFGSIFCTIYMRGVNIWGFRHALQIVRGKYDNPKETGEVTHFQALCSALSATVGLGNIAGVTIAMTMGGPGAFFWMVFCGFFGMTAKFVECTLGQKYRRVKPDGTVLGGPMQYLYEGFKELKLAPIGLVLSILFSIMCILASLGGGNMFQANQSGQLVLRVVQEDDQSELNEVNKQIKAAAAADQYEELANLQTRKSQLEGEMKTFKNVFSASYGILLALMVGIVIIGGIKRIGKAAEKVVPTMCLIYVAACLIIIFSNLPAVPEMIAKIFTEAWNPQAFGGGFIGVLVIGVQRAAFSNEAGVGSASIAHSAARTEEPVREGSVALLGPFIDTIIVCSMTALVILITKAWKNQEITGAPLTMEAFDSQIDGFRYILGIAVVLFAYSTIISWSYYGERCWERLFGPRSTIVYKVIFVAAVFFGAIFHLGAVLEFSDMMILSMAFPNILGLLLLSPKVRRDLKDYWKRYKEGQFKTYK